MNSAAGTFAAGLVEVSASAGVEAARTAGPLCRSGPWRRRRHCCRLFRRRRYRSTAALRDHTGRNRNCRLS
jgi:hypothetical protein